MSPTLVVLEWLDSCALHGGTWNDTEDAAAISPSRCRSVGWILREDKQAIVLASHFAEHQVGGEMCILKKTIVRRWTLANPIKKVM